MKTIFLFISVIAFTVLLIPFVSYAWDPPIGIPRPSFGIEEIAPAYTYYVDQYNSAATDANGNTGSPSLPRKTIPSSLQPGDIVEVHGIYDISSNGYTLIYGNGTSQQPIFIRGGNAEKAIFTNKIKPVGSYIIFENIDVNQRFEIPAADNHIAIRNSKIHDVPGTAITLSSSSSGNNVTDIVIFNNTIYHNGRFDPDGSFTNEEFDAHCIIPQEGSDRIWIVDNDMSWCQGDGVQAQRAKHIYIGRNHFGHMGENAVDLKVPQDVIISQNTMHGYYSKVITGEGGGIGEAIVIHDNLKNAEYPYPERIWVLYNEIYDAQYGIDSTQGDEINIVGNVIHDMWKYPTDTHANKSIWLSGAGIQLHGYHISVQGNVIYKVFLGIGAELSVNTYLSIQNNIISDMVTDDNYDISIVPINSSADANLNSMSFDNNLFYQQGSAVKIGWDSPTYNVAQLQAIGKCLNCLETNPLFASPSSNDFHLQQNSPAIDSGVLSDIYQTFFNLYGIDLKKDFDGVSRPRGLTWDIGAYESPYTRTTPLPSPSPYPSPTPTPRITPTPTFTSSPSPSPTGTLVPTPQVSPSLTPTPVLTPTLSTTPTPTSTPTVTPTPVVSPTPSIVPSGAPQHLQATPGNGRVTLTWDAVPGALFYTVYRQDGTLFYNQGTTTNPSFTSAGLANGYPYTFKVSATDSSFHESFSDPVTATPSLTAQAPSPLPTPSSPPAPTSLLTPSPTPLPPNSLDLLKAKIRELQLQIIRLLQMLIQIYEQKVVTSIRR